MKAKQIEMRKKPSEMTQNESVRIKDNSSKTEKETITKKESGLDVKITNYLIYILLCRFYINPTRIGSKINSK